MIEIVVYLAAVIVFILRVEGVTSVAYQAMAHCLVGFLFGYGANRNSTPERRDGALLLAVALTALEVVAFLVSRLA